MLRPAHRPSRHFTLFLPSFPPDQQLIMAPKKDQGASNPMFISRLCSSYISAPSLAPLTCYNQLIALSLLAMISGLDPKSIVINIATTFLFLLPFLSYFDRGNSMNYVKGVAASFAVAFIDPPVGWMRPHPYTDKPGNTPIGWKQK